MFRVTPSFIFILQSLVLPVSMIAVRLSTVKGRLDLLLLSGSS